MLFLGVLIFMNLENQEHSQKEAEDNGYMGVGGFVFEMVKIILFAFLIVAPIRIFIF